MNFKSILENRRNEEMKAVAHADDKESAKSRLNVIRAALTEITVAETAGKERKELSDNEAMNVVRKMVKTRRDSAELFKEKGVAQERIDKELFEALYLENLLPSQLSEEETRAIVLSVVEDENLRGMGMRGMKTIMSKIGGRTDLDKGLVSKIARIELS